MKRCLITTIAIMVILTMTLGVYAQGQAGGGEGRGGGRGTGARGGRGTQQLQDAIAAMEAQIAELKKNVEAQAAMRRGRQEGETPSEEEIAKMREQRSKLREQQQAAAAVIEQQVMILKGNQLQAEHQAEIDELQAIEDSATKENATVTAKMVQTLIAKRTKAFEDTVEKLGIRLRGGRGGQMGQGQGGGQRGGQRRGQQQQ